VLRSDVSALARGRGIHLGDLTAVLADRYGDRPAVEDPAPPPGLDHGPVRTFRQLEEAVGRIAAALEPHAAVRPANASWWWSTTASTSPCTRSRWPGSARCPVPVNDRLTTHELAAIAEATGATAAIVDAGVATASPTGLELLTAEEHRRGPAGPPGPPPRGRR
jgi:acyl-CoA synthetase (AMP-forming)/AMP-acid ligase II